MDLVGWDRAVFERIRAAYADLAQRLDIGQFHVLPLSALEGDNVVNRSARTPRYDGPPLLSLLEPLGPAADAPAQPLRFPVEWVARHGGAPADATHARRRADDTAEMS